MKLSGVYIKKRRNEIGMSQKELSNKTGLSQGYISKIENRNLLNGSGLRFEDALKLLIALKVTFVFYERSPK